MGVKLAERTTEEIVAARQLDIGAGPIREEGWESLDISPIYGPDYEYDLTQIPWPFEDETFARVRASHVLEHIERRYMIPVVNELWRVLKPGGTAQVEVPLFPYWTAISDPTHVSFFVPQTFAHFCTAESYRKAMRGSSALFDYSKHRELYGIKEWVLLQAKRNEMGSILWVEMQKP